MGMGVRRHGDRVSEWSRARLGSGHQSGLLAFPDPPLPRFCRSLFQTKKERECCEARRVSSLASWGGGRGGVGTQARCPPPPHTTCRWGEGCASVQKLWSTPLSFLPLVSPAPRYVCSDPPAPQLPPGKTLPSRPRHVASPPRADTPHHHPQPRSVPGWDPAPGARSQADITHPTPAPGPSAHAVPSSASALTPGPAAAAADAAASSVAKGGA